MPSRDALVNQKWRPGAARRRPDKEKGQDFETFARGSAKTVLVCIHLYMGANWSPPPWRNPRKGRDQILQRSIAEPQSRSSKGQTHKILKSGYSHLATMKWSNHPNNDQTSRQILKLWEGQAGRRRYPIIDPSLRRRKTKGGGWVIHHRRKPHPPS